MTADWQEKPLGEVFKFYNGKAIKPGGIGEYPVYGSNGIIGGSDEFKYEDAIIIGRVGAYCGSVLYCNGRLWASDNTIVAKPYNEELDIQFAFYMLKTMNLNYYAGGAAQPLMTQTVLKGITTITPPLTTQRKIAGVLSAYDNLIENNTRRIAILEEMAQRIYKEWFVDFKYPGHENDTMVDSELGIIPEGWPIGELGDFIEFKRGKNLTKKQMIRGNIPVVSAGINPSGYHNISNVNGPVVTVSASGANAGYISLYLRNVWASDCSYFNIESTGHFFYYYSLINSRKKEIDNMQRGAAQPHVYPKDLMGLLITNPTKMLLDKFEDITKVIFYKIGNLRKSSINLRQTRDLLLPKLISGQVDVSELNIHIGES